MNDGWGERMTGKVGAVITKRQPRNNGRGGEGIHVKTEIKEGGADIHERANRYRARRRQRGGAVRRCYRTGRDVGKCNSADEVVKCNGERSR